MNQRLLVVDDDRDLRANLVRLLGRAGVDVEGAKDGDEALRQIDSGAHYDLVLTDVQMPKLDGHQLFERLRAKHPSIDVMLMTGHSDVARAVEALKQGACDYITKPFSPKELTARVMRICQHRDALERLRAPNDDADTGSLGIVGQSKSVQQLRNLVRQIAASDASVVIQGESGTGKELVARALHRLSSRNRRKFVAVNCAAFPETLIEAELFGHQRGAFTGAVRDRDGRFVSANGGTLFLDEVAEIPMAVQAKLLRVLQEGLVGPLGSDQEVPTNVRLVCATHRNLRELVKEGTFRTDLYYRLKVVEIPVPPLRKRRSDIPLLVRHFLRKYKKEAGLVTRQAWHLLQTYPFPGNIRELQHAVEHAAIMAGDGPIDFEHMPQEMRDSISDSSSGAILPLAEAVRDFERGYLAHVLSLNRGRKLNAAKALGISRKTLWAKLRNHGISTAD